MKIKNRIICCMSLVLLMSTTGVNNNVLAASKNDKKYYISGFIGNSNIVSNETTIEGSIGMSTFAAPADGSLSGVNINLDDINADYQLDATKTVTFGDSGGGDSSGGGLKTSNDAEWAKLNYGLEIGYRVTDNISVSFITDMKTAEYKNSSSASDNTRSGSKTVSPRTDGTPTTTYSGKLYYNEVPAADSYTAKAAGINAVSYDDGIKLNIGDKDSVKNNAILTTGLPLGFADDEGKAVYYHKGMDATGAITKLGELSGDIGDVEGKVFFADNTVNIEPLIKYLTGDKSESAIHKQEAMDMTKLVGNKTTEKFLKVTGLGHEIVETVETTPAPKGAIPDAEPILPNIVSVKTTELSKIYFGLNADYNYKINDKIGLFVGGGIGVNKVNGKLNVQTGAATVSSPSRAAGDTITTTKIHNFYPLAATEAGAITEVQSLIGANQPYNNSDGAATSASYYIRKLAEAPAGVDLNDTAIASQYAMLKADGTLQIKDTKDGGNTALLLETIEAIENGPGAGNPAAATPIMDAAATSDTSGKIDNIYLTKSIASGQDSVLFVQGDATPHSDDATMITQQEVDVPNTKESFNALFTGGGSYTAGTDNTYTETIEEVESEGTRTVDPAALVDKDNTKEFNDYQYALNARVGAEYKLSDYLSAYVAYSARYNFSRDITVDVSSIGEFNPAGGTRTYKVEAKPTSGGTPYTGDKAAVISYEPIAASYETAYEAYGKTEMQDPVTLPAVVGKAFESTTTDGATGAPGDIATDGATGAPGDIVDQDTALVTYSDEQIPASRSGKSSIKSSGISSKTKVKLDSGIEHVISVGFKFSF